MSWSKKLSAHVLGVQEWRDPAESNFKALSGVKQRVINKILWNIKIKQKDFIY